MVSNNDIEKIRAGFPVLSEEVNGHPLIYFDNAATTQKPREVIDAISGYYQHYNSNIHRGAHFMAEKATRAFEATRKSVQQFINADEAEEVIFTYGTTDSINLVANSYGRHHLGKGDEVIISAMEHHSNIVPWQLVCDETGARLKVIPMSEDGELLMEKYESLLSDRTRIVAVTHVSNSLGTINPVKKIIELAHLKGAVVLIDGAQAVAHLDVDVKALKCDFYAFSAHKLFGPTGTGILYGKRKILEKMKPYRGGGEMIKEVTFEKTTFNDIPYKFEAGTPNIADVVGMNAALQYLNGLDLPALRSHEEHILKYVTAQLREINAVNIIGTAREKVGLVSFTIDNLHPFDVGMLLDARGIAVRTGHHCTQPVMEFFNIEGTIRASFSFYNTIYEVDFFIENLTNIIERWK